MNQISCQMAGGPVWAGPLHVSHVTPHLFSNSTMTSTTHPFSDISVGKPSSQQAERQALFPEQTIVSVPSRDVYSF